jgi:hypothetical protein
MFPYTKLYRVDIIKSTTLERHKTINQKERVKMTVKFEGKVITLTQDAYIDGPADERPIYKAHGVDEEGNEYIVTWDVVDGYEEITDESEMCDWKHPIGIMAL